MNGSDSNGQRNVRSDNEKDIPNVESVDKREAPRSHFDTDEEAAANQYIPVVNGLDVMHEKNLTFSAIIKGNAAVPLTNFERKAALINM